MKKKRQDEMLKLAIASNPKFEASDIEITKEIQQALKSVSISLYDHFLVSAGEFHSARNMRLLDRKTKQYTND